jgi:nucleotide-binding universal stress UspA family protein
MLPLKLHTIVVAVAADEGSRAALRAAEHLAKAAGAKLHVIHVEHADAGTAAPFDHSSIEKSDARFHSLQGDPPAVIRQFASRVGASVIVVGPHRAKGDEHKLSTAMGIVSRAEAPCLVVGDELQLPLKHVVVPIDLSDTARGALVVGLSWASALRHARSDAATALDVVYVTPSSEGSSADRARVLQHEMDLLRADAGSWAGVAIEDHTVQSSDAAESIASFARNRGADLVVMGTRGRGASTAPVGSVTAALLRKTRVPLLLVPPSIWKEYSRTTGSSTTKAAPA